MMPSSSGLVVTVSQSAELHYITSQRSMAVISQELLKDKLLCYPVIYTAFKLYL